MDERVLWIVQVDGDDTLWHTTTGFTHQEALRGFDTEQVAGWLSVIARGGPNERPKTRTGYVRISDINRIWVDVDLDEKEAVPTLTMDGPNPFGGTGERRYDIGGCHSSSD